MEESTAVAVQPWVPPAEGVVVVEQVGTGFIVEGGLAAEVSGETGWGIHLASERGADLDWRAELAASMTGSVESRPAEIIDVSSSAHATALTPPGAPAPPHATTPTLATPTGRGSAWRSSTVPALDDGETDAGVAFEVPAAQPRAGIWSLDGGSTSLGALVSGGLQVDGVAVSLAELEAVTRVHLGGSASARMDTDRAVEAFAELEHDTLPRAGGQTHVVVRVRGAATPTGARGPVRVHLVLDRSSSMQRTWPRVIASARALIARLRPDDQLQIVAYGTDVVEAFRLGPVGDGRAANATLSDIVVGGGTHIEGGLSMAYAAAARAADPGRGLVLLLSDGVPNHGAFEPTELSALASHAREQSGCTTTVVGLGTEFDARLLRSIARAGRGGYHVAVNIDGLARELEGELEAYARAAATDLSVSVRLAQGVELSAEGPWTPTADGARVTFPQLAAGEERSVVLPVRVSASASAQAVASVQVRYLSRLSAGWVSADRALLISRGPAAVQTGLALQALLDRSLGAALDRAAEAVRQGDGQAAAQALRSHALTTQGRIEHRTSAPLQARVRILQRAAQALEALTPAASHGLRRRVSLGLGQMAARIAQ